MLDVTTIIRAGFWTAAFWYFQPCAWSSDLLRRLFFTIATLFDAEPDKLMGDHRPPYAGTKTFQMLLASK